MAIVLPHLYAGGAERVALIFARNMVDRGADVSLIIIYGEGRLMSKIPRGVDSVTLGIPKTSSSIWALNRKLKELAPDYVFTTHYTTAFIVQACKILSFNSKHIARVPGSPLYERESGYYGWFRRACYRWALNRADLVIAQTNQMRDEINQIYRIATNNIHVVRNPIDVDHIKVNVPINYELFTFVAVGRLHSVKGFDILVDAFSELKLEYSEIQLLILGSDKGGKKEIINRINANGVKESVKLLGEVDNVADYLISANGFVLSSHSEGSPNALFEAMSLRVPVVVTDCFSDVEVFVEEGVNGYICKKGSVNALYKAMKNLMEKNLEIIEFSYPEGSLWELIENIDE